MSTCHVRTIPSLVPSTDMRKSIIADNRTNARHLIRIGDHDVTYKPFNFSNNISNLDREYDIALYGPDVVGKLFPRQDWEIKTDDYILPKETIVLCCSLEGGHTQQYIKNAIELYRKKFDRRVIAISQNQLACDDKEIFYCNFAWNSNGFTYNNGDVIRGVNELSYDQEFAYNYIVGTLRHHKLHMMNQLYKRGLLSDDICLWNCLYYKPDQINIRTHRLHIQSLTKRAEPGLLEMLPRVKFTRKGNSITIGEMLMKFSPNVEQLGMLTSLPYVEQAISLVLPYATYSSKFTLVQETEMIEHTNRYTEKTLRPMHALKPFIVAGNLGCLDALKKDGFLTFHPYIDETYDKTENVQDRMTLICNEVERLSGFTLDQWKTFYEQTRDIIEYNKRVCDTLSKKYSETLNEIVSQ